MASRSDSDPTPRASGRPPVARLGGAPPPTPADGDIPAWVRKYIGREIGFRFRILKVLATGGMGSIFLGEQTNLSRQVAIKLVRTSDAEMIQRMRQEAESLAAVSHPAIVEVHDFIAVTGPRASDCYLVMGYVPGRDLALYLDEVERGFLPPAEAVRLLLPVASALVELHAREMIHRDIKPSNIIRFERADGAVCTKLVDFGFARKKFDPSLTAKGIVVGTPAYFAPEIVLGNSHSPASDVYAFGVTLCKLLTGQSPHGEVDIGHLLQKAVRESVALPVWLMSTSLGPVVQAMLKRAPEQRPTMREVLEKLEGSLGGLADVDPTADPEAVSTPQADDETDPAAVPVDVGGGAGRSRPSPGRAARIALPVLGTLCAGLASAVVFFALQWAPRSASTSGQRPAVVSGDAPGSTGRPRPAKPPPATPRIGPRPTMTVPRPAAAPLPTVAEIRRGCDSQAKMRRLFHPARKIIQGRLRGDLEQARRVMEALLPAKCTPDATRHWVSYYLTIAYVRQGRCADARRAWTLYERFGVERRGRTPSFPKCP